MTTLCPRCQNEEAQIHPILKVLPGLRCQSQMATYSLPDRPVEFVGENIKEQRKEYAKSTVQPYRSGQLSKEYLDLYGTKGIQASEQEIKGAKEVWKEDISTNFDLKKTK